MQSITFAEFKAFCLFTNNLEDFAFTMKLISEANRPIGKGEIPHLIYYSPFEIPFRYLLAVVCCVCIVVVMFYCIVEASYWTSCLANTNRLFFVPTAAQFKRAVKIATGHDLSENVLDTVFKIFDLDGDNCLSHKEFLGVMHDRMLRGLKVTLLK